MQVWRSSGRWRCLVTMAHRMDMLKSTSGVIMLTRFSRRQSLFRTCADRLAGGPGPKLDIL